MGASASYAVIGLGLFGSAIARTLAQLGHHVLAVDLQLAPVELLGPEVAEAVQADATDRAALEALRLERFEVVFNTIGDLSSSILCTLALREQRVRRIVAKVNSPQQGRILTRLGAESILFPERDMGERVARTVAGAPIGVVPRMELSEGASLLEIPAPAALVGRSLAEAEVRRRFGVTVVSVRRRTGGGGALGTIVSPPADLVIGPGDLLLVAGTNEDLARFRQAAD